MGEIVPESPLKGNIRGNTRLKTLLLVALVVLVGVASFGLGRLSARSEVQSGLVIHEPQGSQ